MTDAEKRENVILGLESCSGKAIFEAKCPFNCPYAVSTGKTWTEPDCCEQLIKDALALLKEQEAVEPKLYTPEDKTIWSSWHICGACEHPVNPGDKFCRECGRPIKWEEQDG